MRAPEVNSSVGPFEMLGDLDGVPLMGSAEIRVGPIGLLGDVSHVPVETNITTRNVFFRGGQAALRTNTGTALVLYRLVDAPNQFADLGVGFRSWGFGINVSAGSASGAHTDWQAMGTVDYALNSWITLRAGYRSLNFNYSASDSNLSFNVHMRGPIFAGTFRF